MSKDAIRSGFLKSARPVRQTVGKNQFVLQFEPGVSIERVKEWVSHLYRQAQRIPSGRAGLQATKPVEVQVAANGSVLVSSEYAAAMQQVLVDGGIIANGASQPKPNPPRPTIPTDFDPNSIVFNEKQQFAF